MGARVGRQGQLDRLVQQWRGCLETMRRPWDVEDIAAALRGEDVCTGTPLEDLMDVDRLRTLSDQVAAKVVTAYQHAEDFKQVLISQFFISSEPDID
jgi:hypothetical protein